MFNWISKLNVAVSKLFGYGLIAVVCSVWSVASVAHTVTVQEIEPAVTAFQTINTLRNETPVDADAIAAAYSGALAAVVEEIDEHNHFGLDEEIQTAIEDLRNDIETRVAGQVVDKTLQRAFYQIIWNRISAIRDDFDTATTDALGQMLDEAEAAFLAIFGTVGRDDQMLTADRQAIEEGEDPGLDNQVFDGFARIRTAINKNNPDEDFNIIQYERYAIRLSLTRGYYIGVLREVAGMLENRVTDPETARVEQKEAEIFYRIFETLVSRDNPAGHRYILSVFTGDMDNIEPDRIVSELSVGLLGRSRVELEKQELFIGIDSSRAIAEAAGAQYYAQIFMPDLEVRLGATERSNLETAFDDLQAASNANNVEDSATAREAILAIFDRYEEALTLAEYTITDSTAIIANAVDSFSEVGTLRRQNPLNADALAQQYAGDLQQLTQIVDQIYGTPIDSEVLAAIDAIRIQPQNPQAAQIIDKSLQRVFALVVYNRVKLVLDHFDTMPTSQLKLEWDRAYEAYQAIDGTASRENKVLTPDRLTVQSGSNPDLDYQIATAFVEGAQAFDKVNANDDLDASIAMENIVVSLIRSFYIGVLREIEGIIDERDGNLTEALEKQTEGIQFYRIIEGVIGHNNAAGNARIKSQLTGDVSSVVAVELVNDLGKGIVGQLKDNIALIEALDGSDQKQSLIAQERLSLYLGVLQPDLDLRLGSAERIRMENALRRIKEGIQQANNPAKIAAGIAVLNDVIAAYENELI